MLHGRLAPVIELDGDLAEGLDPADLGRIRGSALARWVRLRAGESRAPWGFPHGDGDLGLLVLEGVLLREARVGASALELIGKGDLIRPWDPTDPHGGIAATQWCALSPTLLAVLDAAFMRRIAPWPQLTVNLTRRALIRTRSLNVYLAISHITGVDQRVLAILWHFATRWGRVTPEGTIVPIRLTNAMLGEIIGARRQSVSAAVGALDRRGLVSRCRNGCCWILSGSAPLESAG